MRATFVNFAEIVRPLFRCKPILLDQLARQIAPGRGGTS